MASNIAACTMAMSRSWRLLSVSADTVLTAIVFQSVTTSARTVAEKPISASNATYVKYPVLIFNLLLLLETQPAIEAAAASGSFGNLQNEFVLCRSPPDKPGPGACSA